MIKFLERLNLKMNLIQKRTSLITLVALLLTLLLTTPALGLPSEVQWYHEGKQSIIRKDWAAYEASKKLLARSPLLPYLEYHYFNTLLESQNPELILDFIKRNPERPFTATLKNRLFSNELKKKNYTFLLNNELLLNTQNLRCMLYEAQIEENPSLFNTDNFKEEWINALTLPTSCNLAERFWLKRTLPQYLIQEKIYERLERTYITRAKELLPYLSEDEQQFFNHFIPLLEVPKKVLSTTSFYPERGRYYALIIKRWASQNSVAAQEGLDYLMSHNLFTQKEFIPLRNQLAIFQAGRTDAYKPLERILAIPEKERTDQLRQWGFRLAAQAKEYQLAYDFLTHMSNETQKEAVWTYWIGRMNEKLNRHAAAATEYRKIANQPNFYGFLAADKISSDYTVLHQMVRDPVGSAVLPINDEIRTSLLLSLTDEEHYARSEWLNGIRKLTKKEQHFASIYAYQEHLYDFSIRAAIMAKARGGLSLRYPSNYIQEIEHNINDEWLSHYVVLGLIRQESLFHERAKSAANAYGLMQLLIPTAERMSRMLNEPQRESLYNPKANIRYGIAYLHHLSEEVGSCLPHILASYNAGPTTVKRWIWDEMDDVVLWIESIPYYETRNYVKNVLENTIIYHHINNDNERLTRYLQCD